MKDCGTIKEENPFTNQFTNRFTNGYSYTDFIYKQVEGMQQGKEGAIKIDIGGKDLESARMTLRYVASKYGGKYKTKCVNGNLWVMKY